MYVSSVETMVAGYSHEQEYGVMPPVANNDLPHVPALFLGPGFDPTIVTQFDALNCRTIITLNVPSEEEGLPYNRRVVLADALGALLLDDELTVLSSVALQPAGAADILDQIEDDGPLRGFAHYILPQATKKRKLDLPPAARRSLSISYIPDAPPGCDATTALRQYMAIGKLLDAYDRKIYKNIYKYQQKPQS